MSILLSLLSFLVAIGILVTVHEYGHFWVARRVGVKVLRFSIGFGKPLLTKVGRDGVEYVLAAIPLGGYVKMLDESEGEVRAHEREQAFNRKSLSARFAVVLAGPAANLIFAVAAFWLAFVIGIDGVRPVIGQVASEGVAAQAGLRAGHTIVAVDGTSVSTWERVFQRIARASLGGGQVALRVASDDGIERDLTLDMEGISLDELSEGRMFSRLGFEQARPQLDPVLGKLVSGGPAANAGLREGDRVVSIDGQPIDDWSALVDAVKASPGKPIALNIEREGNSLSVPVTPEVIGEGEQRFGRIGANWRNDPQAMGALRGVEQYGPLEAVGKAFSKTLDTVTLILEAAWRMLTLQLSAKNISGPVQIAEYAGLHASIGLAYFAGFLAFVSVSLGVLNLLPVPMLDGGHALYYIIEAIRGKPLSLDAQFFGQRIGLVLLVGLMGIAFYNDFARLLG